MDQRSSSDVHVHPSANNSSTFSIPKVQRFPSQGCRHFLELKSRQAKDVISIIRKTVLDKQLKWQANIVCTVSNDRLNFNFAMKKQELKQELSKDPTESFAFGITQWEHEADGICSNGDFSCQHLNVPLGLVDQGVNVCLYPDVLLQWAEKKGFRQPCIVIYKILKGRCKTVPARTSTKDPVLDPTPNMECHISSGNANPSEPIFKQLSKSQVFLFEYDEEALPSKHPRHCLPYATISLKSRKPETAASTETGSFVEESNEHVQSSAKETGVAKQMDRKRKADTYKWAPLTGVCNSIKSPLKNGSKNLSPSKKVITKSCPRNEKENGMVMPIRKQEEALMIPERPTDGARMKLSDRFANINPSQSKLEDPRLEELRQEHIKALKKLKAVRTERFNNAMLGFGSSSEDEQHPSAKTARSPKSPDLRKDSNSSSTSFPVPRNESRIESQNKKSGQDESFLLESDSIKTESHFGQLKITIDNGRHSSENGSESEIDTSTHPLQVMRGREEDKGRHEKPKQRPNVDKRQARSTDLSRSTGKSSRTQKYQEQRGKDQARGNRHFNDKQSRASERWQSPAQTTSPETYGGYRGNGFCNRPRGRGFGYLRGRGHFRGRGHYRGRGYSRGRSRMRFQCPEYFRSDDGSHVFDVEEELYEAASARSNKGQTLGKMKDPSPAKNLNIAASVPGSWQNDERIQEQKLQSRDHHSNEERDYNSSASCNSSLQNPVWTPEEVGNPTTGASTSKLDFYRSLSLEKLSPDDALEPEVSVQNNIARNSDNMEVQDMDIEDSSRDSWQSDPRPQGSIEGNQWTHSQSLVASMPTSGTHNIYACGSSFGKVTQSGYNILTNIDEEQHCSALNVSGVYRQASVITSAPVQEAMKMLEQQIEQARTPEQKGVFQLALQSFLQKCASEQDGNHLTTVPTRGNGESVTLTDRPRKDALSTHMDNKHILAGVTECLDHDEVKQEFSSASSSISMGPSSRKNITDVPQKTKSKRKFHGRLLITKGDVREPHKILLENISGQIKPVDPRAALSALFGRKFEIDLRVVSWSSDKEEPKSSKDVHVDGQNDSCKLDKVDVQSSRKDPRLMKQNQSSNIASSPTRPRGHVSRSDHSNLPVAKSKQVVNSEPPLNSNGHPATQFLKKLQHVNSLNIASMKLESSRTQDSGSSSGKSFTQSDASIFVKKYATRDKRKKTSTDTNQNYLIETQESNGTVNRERTRSRRHSNGSNCNGRSSVSFSSAGSHKVPVQPRSSPPQSRSPHRGISPKGSRSPCRGKSPQSRSRSPLGSQFSQHRRSPMQKCRSSFQRSRSRERIPRSSSPKSIQTSFSRGEERSLYKKTRRKSLESLSVRTSNSEPSYRLQKTGSHNLNDITSMLSALRSSTHQAAQRMSHCQTDQTAFKQSCFSCLGQYNTLWLKVSMALASLKDGKNSAAEYDKRNFETGIEDYEQIAANIHLQLELLVQYFDPDDLDKAGIHDWNFRPLSGVEGLSERGHLSILQHLKEMYQQQNHTDDLLKFVCHKMNLLEKKLKSSISCSYPEIQSYSNFPQQAFGVFPSQEYGLRIPSIVTHRHSNIVKQSSNQDHMPIETIISPGSQQNQFTPNQTQDIRRVVMRSVKTETHGDVEQQRFGTSNPAAQSADFMQRNI